MSVFSDKPGFREQMVTALAGSQMTPVEGRECSLDRIAAFGAAQIAVTSGASGALEHAQALAAQAVDYSAGDAELEARRVTGEYASFSIDPPAGDAERVREVSVDPLAYLARGASPAAFPIEPELAALLLRLKYFPEQSAALRGPALERFAGVIWRDMRRRRDRNRKESRAVLANVASQALDEWIAGACTLCKGVGRIGASVGGVKERLVRCRVCERVPGPKYALRDLTDEERIACPGYAKFEVIGRPGGGRELGRYWTKEELDRVGSPSGVMSVTLPELKGRDGKPLLGKDGRPLRARVSCIACCGRGTIIDRKRERGRAGNVCGRCGGFGHFTPNDDARAEAIGVGKYVYRNRWKVTFDAALRAARALDRRLVEGARKQLRTLGGAHALAAGAGE